MTDLTQNQLETQRAFAEACKPAPIPAVEDTGIILGVPALEYHRREFRVASKSALDHVERSPAHYHAWLNGAEQPSTAAMRFGTAFHTAVLEPAVFAETYAVRPDFGDLRTNAGKARRDAWLADNAGKTPLSAEDEDALCGMLASIMRHPAASRLIVEGVPEVTLRWVDPATGVRCKSRADYWIEGKRLAVDLKTTEDASSDAFARSVVKHRYHVQDAMYRAGFTALGASISHFAIVAVEKTQPYAVAVYTLDLEAVEKGYHAFRRDIETLAECIRANAFPAYSDGVETLSLPAWA